MWEYFVLRGDVATVEPLQRLVLGWDGGLSSEPFALSIVVHRVSGVCVLRMC